MRWQRFRTWSKWACTIVAVTTTVALFGSRWYSLWVWWDLPDLQQPSAWPWASTRDLTLTGGRLWVARYTNQRGLDWPTPSHLLL